MSGGSAEPTMLVLHFPTCYPKLGNCCLEPSRSSTAPDCQSTSVPAASVKVKLSSEVSKAFSGNSDGSAH
jgi:hypothetical protein